MTQNPYEEYVSADFDRRIRCACSTYILGSEHDARTVDDMTHSAMLCTLTQKGPRP